jgi:glycosyltransferase involved in cell wall biosynthesis
MYTRFARSGMYFLDLSHTSHTHARTGIQRVCRSLSAALSQGSSPVNALTYDPFRECWRPLQGWENHNLLNPATAAKRGARWPWTARWTGRLAKWSGRRPFVLPTASGLIVPEIFSPQVAGAFPSLFARVNGPRVALFHDAIALKYPELTPVKTVARFPAYLRELLAFDGIAAVSEDSRRSLLDYWKWLGLSSHPPVVAIPLGIDSAPAALPFSSKAKTIVLSVGSIEGRKNHLALLEACDRLWTHGFSFELHLIGLAHAQTGRAALQKIQSLQAQGRALRYDGPVSDEALEAAYRKCTFTVYPSLIEGFGLPVLESLARGKPCLCSNRGALGEAARGGGCVTLEDVSADSLEPALRNLLSKPSDLVGLISAAQKRTFKTWTQYSGELTAWMQALKSGSSPAA